MKDQNAPKEPRLFDDPRPAGRYANGHAIVVTQDAMRIDFVCGVPPDIFVTSRTWLSFAHVEGLIKSLQDNLNLAKQQAKQQQLIVVPQVQGQA